MKPVMSLDKTQTAITQWLKSHNIPVISCETDSGDGRVFCYKLHEKKYIEGRLIIKETCIPEWVDELIIYITITGNEAHIIIDNTDIFKIDHKGPITVSPDINSLYRFLLQELHKGITDEEKPEEENPEKEDKVLTNLDRYVKTTKVFDSSKLKIGAPYKIHNVQTDEYVYAILEKAESEKLTFGWFYVKEQTWDKWVVEPDDLLVITPLFEEE
jgi:hypothetical protein